MKATSVIASLALLAFAACAGSSSKDTSSPETADAGGLDTGAPPPTEDAGNTPSSQPGLDASDDTTPPVCSDKPKQVDCVSCCAALHEAGSITYIAAIAECMCVPDKCQTQCAGTLCNDDPREPDGPCQGCLKANEASCNADLSKTCADDPDCVSFNLCLRGAGCNTKS